MADLPETLTAEQKLARLNSWLDLTKFVLGSVAVVLIGAILGHIIKGREVAIKESEEIGKYIPNALEADGRKRYQFADFFAHVTRDKDYRNQWIAYRDDIGKEIAKDKQAQEQQQQLLAQINSGNLTAEKKAEVTKQLNKVEADRQASEIKLAPLIQPLKQRVSNRGAPPDSFLNELVAWGKTAPDEIFVADGPEDSKGVYASVEKTLGPWRGPSHRRAVMLEVMCVLAGFESNWNWSAGRDMTDSSETNPESTSAGAWQTAANSMNFGAELKDLVLTKVGTVNPLDFQRSMKADHSFAMEYVARLLRRTTRHHGAFFRHEIDRWLSREAVDEFESLIGDGQKGILDEAKPSVSNTTPPPQPATSAKSP